ncbi:MAG: glycosyltransferase family 4 protein [Sphingomicrobium sp.]
MSDDAPLLLDTTRLIWRRWKGRYPTGIDRVCLAYLRHFGDRAQAVVQHDRFRRILSQEASRELFDLLEGPPDRFRRVLPWRVLRHFGNMSCRGHGRPYLNIGHTGLNAAGFRGWIRRADVRPVYLVHDLIPITHPEFCRPGEAERHQERMRTVLMTASGIVGNSQVTLDELAVFAGAEGLPTAPSIAAWLGVDPLPVPPRPQVPERRTFVVVGTIEARKNHHLLLEIWSRLVDRLGTKSPRLLIIGQRGWEAEEVFRRLDRPGKLEGHVVELGSCSDEQLAEHLVTARALLFPSLVEGYGLPLVEALAIGVPVIASDLTVFREIGGDIPDYLDARDGSGWESAIIDYAQPDSASRAAQLQRMKGFRAPDWAGHFRAVEHWLSSRDAPALT